MCICKLMMMLDAYQHYKCITYTMITEYWKLKVRKLSKKNFVKSLTKYKNYVKLLSVVIPNFYAKF